MRISLSNTLRKIALAFMLSAILAGTAAFAQVKLPKVSPLAVPQVSGNFLEQTGAQPHFARFNKMPAGVLSALRAAAPTGAAASSRTIPFFMGAFLFNGTSHPYFMVGNDPQRGNETRINTAVIPLNFFFDEWLDSSGKHISIKVASVLDQALTSPNFVKSAYSNGFGQFGDAVQRAEFFSVMKDSWHTTLNRPRLITPVTIAVPFGQSQVFQLPDGSFMATLSADFFESQLSTILQLAGQKPQEFPILLSKNVFLYAGDPANCCILGFHSAYDVSAAGHPAVQTFAWASWTSEGIFSSFSDVTPLSHEISEWMNDPFVSNTVPAWQSPNGHDCTGKLSSGDPTEVFANSVFPITLHGFPYHPQNEALLPWFAREDPSSAFRGAYSYPDTSLLTEAAQDCQ